jgi:hypothetical protein
MGCSFQITQFARRRRQLDVERSSDRQRSEKVVHVVDPMERRLDFHAVSLRLGDEPQATRRALDVLGPEMGFFFDSETNVAPGKPFGFFENERIVGVDDRGGVRPQASEKLPFRACDRSQRRKELSMDFRDTQHDTYVGSRNFREAGDLAWGRHPHLQNRHVLVLPSQDRQRQAIEVVEITL